MGLREDAAAIAGELAELRHAIIGEPEIGLDLPLTQAKVLAALDGLPLEVSTGRKLSSVTAVLRGGSEPAGSPAGSSPGSSAGARPVVLRRGDMDALPVTEATGLPYASRFPGVMHACGHDLHTAMLAGAARLLSAHRAELPGDVIFMFQPGEEGYRGADLMISEGVLDAAGPLSRRRPRGGRRPPTPCTCPRPSCRAGCSPPGPGRCWPRPTSSGSRCAAAAATPPSRTWPPTRSPPPARW